MNLCTTGLWLAVCHFFTTVITIDDLVHGLHIGYTADIALADCKLDIMEVETVERSFKA
jgi:hypothetical protein